MITIDARWIVSSGIGTYLQNLVPGILERFSGTEVTLLGDEELLINTLKFLPENCKVVRARADMYSVREQIEYVRLIPRRTKLYFSPHYNVPLFYFGRMLVTVYDVMHLAKPEFVCGYHRRLYAKFMFLAVRNKADSVLTISEFTMSEMVRTIGQFRQPIIPIHLGVSKDWFSIPKGKSPHGRPYILYVGNIKPHKNLKLLIRSFILMADKFKHDLVLVGKKEGFINGDNAVLDLAQGLPGRIHFTGRVSNDELHQYFSNADAFVFPSLYEGFGLPPLEAMAAGCPVLVSSVGALREVCGDAALYFDPFDELDLCRKLVRIITDKILRDELRFRGFAQARNFTWERCVDRTCDVIADLIK